MTRSHHAAPRLVRHVIETIHFGPKAGPSDCSCSCGWQGDSATPEQLDLDWRAHRRAVGAPTVNTSDLIRAGSGIRFNGPVGRAKPASEWLT